MDIPRPRIGPPDVIRHEQQREGPFLDRLFPVRLASGRIAAVTRIVFAPSNAGILEGGLHETMNDKKMADWVGYVRAELGEPLHIVQPEARPLPQDSSPRRQRVRLPWMACAAILVSRPIDADMAESRLTLLWWQDPLEESPRASIERVAQDVDWEREARDLDLL